MSRLRLAIPISVQFSIRYAIRTGLIQQIGAYATPVVFLRWDDPELRWELDQAGIENHLLPPSQCGVGYTRIKQQLDVWHLKRLRSPSTAIDARRRRVISPPTLRQQARDALYSFLVRLPGWPQLLLATFQKAILAHTNVGEFVEMLRRLRIDALLSMTPYFQQEQILLYAARSLGLPLYASILSFDNLTTRGWIPITFDAYFLWNKYNVAELRRAYPEARSSRVEIVGPPQFDFYWDESYIWDENDWRKRLGIPADRPVILFGAGHYLIAPQEPVWLQQLDEAIEAREIPGRPVILFRRHPNDPIERWLPALQSTRHVVFDDPWQLGKDNLALTNIRRVDIEKLASSLAYCQVHVNASSTMTVDGAIFDRPQIGPAYDDRPGRSYDRITKELYMREHYLPITKSGGLDVVYSRSEMVRAVRDGFDNPARLAEGRKRIVREICTYDDGRCTERLAEALRLCLSSV